MIKLIGKYLRPYKGLVCAVLCLVALQVVGDLALPTIMATIVDVGLINADMAYILKYGALMLLLSLGTVAAMIGVGYCSARISSGFGRDMRMDIFRNAETFSLNEINQIGVSSMIVRNTQDVTTIQNFSVMVMRMALTAPVMLIGSIVLTVSINKDLSKVLLVAIPLLILLFVSIIGIATRLFIEIRKRNDKLNLLLREHLSGTRVIRAFVNQKTEQDKFNAGNDALYEIALKVAKLMSIMMPAMMLIVNMATVAVCWFGSIQIEQGNLMVGQLMSFVTYVTMILMSLAMLSMLVVMIPRANVSAKRIKEILDKKTVIGEPEKASSPASDGSVAPGTIEFRDVTFKYNGADSPALSHVSFTAEGGKTTAIVGSTGCGKSTLISLIPRLYDVTEGSVLLDGQDVRQFSLEDLRSRLGFVPQKGVLFTGTIAENVRFGYRQATDQEVESALKTAQAWDFVSEKEKGVDELIAQGGKNVSGGQKQRLAIARAIVKPSEAYVFDDSFSALDFATDSQLRLALANDPVIGSKTRIIVAQRISTIMDADNIIVLDNGKVVGQGTHKELLKSCPLYLEIASSQLSEEELAV